MIRIDEIYQNVFVPRALAMSGTGLHWFDPFGSTDIKDMVNLPAIPWGSARHRLIFWDQEPVQHHKIKEFLDIFKSIYDGAISLITSEKNSEIVNLVCDEYGINSQYYFFHAWAALDWYRGYDRTFLYRSFAERSPTKTFLCPNNIIGGERRHRVELLRELACHGLIGRNQISFPARCPVEDLSLQEICENYKIDFDFSGIELPLIIDQGRDHHDNSHRIDLWANADQTLLQVVTETVYRGSRQHLTEKTFKPIVMQQPFVMVSCRHSLEYLRSYGFRTFGDFWDESYDDLDDQDRIIAIAQLLKDINNLSGKEKKQLQKNIAGTVDHNFRWFYSKDFEELLWREIVSIINII